MKTCGQWSVYQPELDFADIYYPHPGRKPCLRYNHDVDIVRFKDRYFAAWNANEVGREDAPGQFNFLSVSDNFENWTTPIRFFMKEGGCENPIDTDNQWQPNFINYHNKTLFCCWCDYVGRRTLIASSKDGLRWRNMDVPIAPPSLKDKVVAFPTNHGLITRRDTMLFPCSLPMVEEKCTVGHTKYAGVLRSSDGGKTWQWSDPIEAVSWSVLGEDSAAFGGETVYLWEPMLFEQADGRIGLLIRNSTAQDAPERLEKPSRMLFYAWSDDDGRTWTKARPVELNTICSRNFAVSGVDGHDALLMVMNDNDVRIPDRISHDRYFLSLYCSPVCDPDVLLPGPVIQPPGGTAFYPNGFVHDRKLYLAYTYPGGIHSTVVSSLPDFSKPFLLPRGGRPGLTIANGMAILGMPQTGLGLVMTARQFHAHALDLRFSLNVNRYAGGSFPILSLGGITHNGTRLRIRFDEGRAKDVFEVQTREGWKVAGTFQMKQWSEVKVHLSPNDCTVAVGDSPPVSVGGPVIRKIAFGGLYEPPEWPMGMQRSMDIRLNLQSLSLETCRA